MPIKHIIKPAIKYTNSVMPGLIRHPVFTEDLRFSLEKQFSLFNCRFTKIIVMLISIGIINFFLSVSTSNSEDWEAFDRTIGGSEGWKLVKDKKGIKVYLRDVDISPIKSFKGVMEIEAKPSTLAAFFLDVDMYTEYVQLCSESKELKRISESEIYFYSVNKPPWPVKPRDSIVHSKWFQDPDTFNITGESIGIPDFVPRKKGYIRVPLLMYCVRISSNNNETANLEYEAIAEVGGWIPNWVVNFCLVDTPYTTLRKVRNLLPIILKKYKNQNISFMKKPPKLD